MKHVPMIDALGAKVLSQLQVFTTNPKEGRTTLEQVAIEQYVNGSFRATVTDSQRLVTVLFGDNTIGDDSLSSEFTIDARELQAAMKELGLKKDEDASMVYWDEPENIVKFTSDMGESHVVVRTDLSFPQWKRLFNGCPIDSYFIEQRTEGSQQKDVAWSAWNPQYLADFSKALGTTAREREEWNPAVFQPIHTELTGLKPWVMHTSRLRQRDGGFPISVVMLLMPVRTSAVL